MASLNKVQLIGYLGADPELRSFANGGRVANFSLATTDTWRDKKSGEKRERTEWHRVSVFSDGLVGVVQQYLKKGGRVYVEGRIETRSYEKDGATRYTTEIVLRNDGALLMLDGAKKETTSAPPAPVADPGQLEPGTWERDDEGQP